MAARKNIAAIILSAGSSQRMGRPKALMEIGGTTFIGKIAREVAAASIAETVIVLGAQQEAIRPALDEFSGRIVINEAWQNGRLSSIIAGIAAIERSGCDGALIWPVDHPLVSSGLIREMMDAFDEADGKIIIPIFSTRRGHPIILPRRCFDEVRNAPAEQGLRAVVHAHADDLCEVPTDEEGILINIDTPEAYAVHCSGAAIAAARRR